VWTLTRNETFTGKGAILCLTVVLRRAGVDEGVDGEVSGDVPRLGWLAASVSEVSEDEVVELV
jgi:hypothetical protein